ncbi:MAG: universal stress protein, partial [Gemmatimonadales bacterium]
MRVMLAFDGSAGAVAARNLVARLPWPAGTAITVVAALERGPDLFGAPYFAVTPHDASESEEMILAELVKSLQDEAEPLRAPDRIVETRVARGRPATALLDEAASLSPDLIVIGSRGHGPMATVLLGSVSTEVADHAPCPVLVARRPSVHRMIVAVDGSESAQRAVATLAGWPIFAGLSARVVTVAERPAAWASSVGAALYPAWLELRDSGADERHERLADIGVRACESLDSA